MRLDIRIPIGLMFFTFGVVLVAFGLLGNKAIYASSLGININFGWGLVLILFGVVMFVLGWRGAKHEPPVTAAEGESKVRPIH